MTTSKFFDGAQEAVAEGTLTEAEIDAAVRRILTLKFELGLFENPRHPDAALQAEFIGSAAHAELNLEAARRSLVLLTNDGTLPLEGGLPEGGDGRATASGPRTIALVGPNADDAQTQLGDWAGSSGQADWLPDGQPRAMIRTVLDGFRDRVPADWTVAYAPGARILDVGPDPEGSSSPTDSPAPRSSSRPRPTRR